MDVHFLHIGKTGGSSVKTYWAELQAKPEFQPKPDSTLLKRPHRFSLADVLSEQPDAQIAFVYRDPIERFISGFNSRLRCGRPRYNSEWKPEEAISYQYFPTASALAQALMGGDERLYSAAQFAMNSISHLKRNLQYHLGSVELLEKHRQHIAFACDLTKLDERASELFSLVAERPNGGWPPMSRQHTGKNDDTLDTDEQAALRQYWQADFEIYDWLSQAFP